METVLAPNDRGQSLIEATFLVPFLLVIAFNAVNLGYFFFAYLNLATAPRQGVQYSILGGATNVGSGIMPSADEVHTLLGADITGAIPGASNAPVRVCVYNNGLNNAGTVNQVPACTNYGSGAGTFTAIQPDPEAPSLVLHRVDIQYTVAPVIPGRVFNIVTGSSLTLHRLVYMRMEQ